MASVLFKNNATSTLASGISDSDTTINLTSGQGARFPTITGSDYFYGTLIDSSNNLEIVKVTARSTDSLTVVRAQDLTSARAYLAADKFELRPTAALFETLSQKTATETITNKTISSSTFSGTSAQVNSIDVATISATQTLTNKTLTSPILGGTLTGTYTIGGTPTLNLDQAGITGNISGNAAGLTSTLGVTGGGTGATTLTGAVVGNGTGAFTAVAPGTTGNLLTSDGSAWTSAALNVQNISVINDGTSNVSHNTEHTYTAGYNKKVLCIMSFLGISQSGSGTVEINFQAGVGASASTTYGVFGPGAVNYWVNFNPTLPIVLSTTGSENRVTLEGYVTGHESFAGLKFCIVAWDA